MAWRNRRRICFWGRREIGYAAGANWLQRQQFHFYLPSSRTSPFTRAFPLRGLTMHVPDPFAQGIRDRPGHVSAPDYMTAFAAVKTRRRAPSNGVSIPELASTAPVAPQPLRSLGERSCVRYSARPGRNSAFRLPSPEDWPFSRTPRMETCVTSPYRSPVPPRPGAPGCSRYGTGGIMAWVWRFGKTGEDYFPISKNKRLISF